MHSADYPPDPLESDDDVRDYLLRNRGQICSGFVYVIDTDALHSPVKIGYAGDPVARLGTLQTGSFRELRLRNIVAAGMDIEREFHDRVGGERVRGEWFAGSRTAMLVAEIATFARYQAEMFAATGEIVQVPHFGAARRLRESNRTPEENAADWKRAVELAQAPCPSYAALASVGKLPPPNVYTDGGRGRKSLRQEMDELRVDGKMPLYIRRKVS